MNNTFNNNILENAHMYGKMLAKQELSIRTIKGQGIFEIYDGFAYCPSFNDHEIAFSLPLCHYIDDNVQFITETILNLLNVKERDEITIVDVALLFGTIYIDNLPYKYNVELNKLMPKI
jgi:hypothetical protein